MLSALPGSQGCGSHCAFFCSLTSAHTHTLLSATPHHSAPRVTASPGSRLHLAEGSPSERTLLATKELGWCMCFVGTVRVLTTGTLPFPDALGCHVLPGSWRSLLPHRDARGS